MGDLQMAIKRGGDPSKNFAVGEPRLLGEVFKTTLAFRKLEVDTTYPTLFGKTKLLEAISASNFTHGKHIVVTNGAKQGLASAFYALNRRGYKKINIPKPYWPSFPTLATMAGLELSQPDSFDSVISLCAAPNNPDGKEFAQPVPVDIWDAAYACPAYAWNGIKPKALVTVHSASKLFGMSGLRLGWVSTDDEELALDIAHYVEYTVSGVDHLAQDYVANLLEITNKNKELLYGPYQYFQEEILDNRINFGNILVEHCEEVSYNKSGMFAWFKPKNPDKFWLTLKKLDLVMVNGVHCGQPGWVRCTLGNAPDLTQKIFNQIRKELDKNV